MHDEHSCSMFSTCAMQQADSACRSVHEIDTWCGASKDMVWQMFWHCQIPPVEIYTSWCMMWCFKRYVSARNIPFLIASLPCKTVCPLSVFGWSIHCLLSDGCGPRGTCLCIRMHDCMCALVFSDRVQGRTDNLFWLVQGLTPWSRSAIFLWVHGSIPRPERLFQACSIHGLCLIPWISSKLDKQFVKFCILQAWSWLRWR